MVCWKGLLVRRFGSFMGKDKKYNPKKLLEHLNELGRASFVDCDFSGKRPRYACVFLDAEDSLAVKLGDEIKARFNFKTGQLAYFSFAGWKTTGENRHVYLIEAIPIKLVDGEEEKKRVSYEALSSLAHEIGNFSLRNPARGRKE